MFLTMNAAVTIWMENGSPVRLFHSGRRWRVIDIPTARVETHYEIPSAITHPPERVMGWRLTGKDEVSGEVFVFDLERRGIDEWFVVHRID